MNQLHIMVSSVAMLGCFYIGSWAFFKINSVDFIVVQHLAYMEQRRREPASYTLDTLLSFAGEITAATKRYQVQGWSHPETWGTWTDGAVAELAMRLTPAPSGPLKLMIRIQTAMTHRQQPIQEIEVLANDAVIGHASFRAGDPPLDLNRLIPATALNNEGMLRLVFRIAHPSSPKALGMSEDPRQLGILVNQIRISTVAVDAP